MSSSELMPVAAPAGPAFALSGLPLLAELPDELRALVTGSFAPVRYRFGQTVFVAGDPADCFCIVRTGLARVVGIGEDGGEVSLNLLRPGDSFGEVGLLEGAPRAATVRAAADLELLRLDGQVFLSLVTLHPELREVFATQTRLRRLTNVLRVHSAFAQLPAAAHVTMLRALEPVELAAGERVLSVGDPAQGLFIVESGRLLARERSGVVSYIRTGDFFGERSLLLDEPVAATIETLEPCRLLRLDSPTFLALLEEHQEFADRIQDRVAGYRRAGRTSVPLDFAGLLPAEAMEQPDTVTPAADARPQMPDGPADDDPASAEPPAPVIRGRRGARSFPFVRQIDEMDCGAACVAMLCRHFGRAVATSHIRMAVGTGTEGTSLRGLQRGCEHVGLAVQTLKASKGRVAELTLPAIIHWEANHWVVLYAVDERSAWIADPARRRRRISREELALGWSGYTAIAEATPRLSEAPLGRARPDWLWPFIAPHRRTLGIGLILAFVTAALQMLFPVLTQQVFDHVLLGGHHAYARLYTLAAAMVALLALSLAVTILQRRMLTRAAVEIDVQTLDHITARMLALPLAYFETRRTGDLERRLNGVRDIRGIVVQGGLAAMTASTQLIVAVILMVVYSPLMGALFLTTVPVYCGLMILSARRIAPTFEALEESAATYSSKQLDALRGIATVKAMGREDGMRTLLVDNLRELGRRMFRSDFTLTAYAGVSASITFLTEVLFLVVGALEVLAGHLTLGGLVAFNTLVLLADAPLGTLLGLWDQMQMSRVLLGRVQDIFDYGEEQSEGGAGARPVPSLSGAVSLRDASFSHPHAPEVKILDRISVDIPAGATVGIVGRSGAGKSTLVKCLAGLMPLTGGQITYDGVDLETLRLVELRRRIGYVLQEPYLFADTIANNIAFGEAAVDLDRVRAVAELADAAEFIHRLALGYDTRVGESGLRLSGGQAQRLAIARALYHEPPILVFDEATSALDAESERAVRENLARMLVGRTAFLVAHRLSTVRDADLILVLEQGRLVERGTHEQLMAREGLYAYLVAQQLA